MKYDKILIIWMFITCSFIIALSAWAIFFVDKIEHQIAIFGIIGVIITAITSVITVTINNKNAKERDLEIIVIKEKQKVFEHFYNAYFEMLSNIKKGKKQGLSNKAENEMMEFKKGMMNWASEGLIIKYLEYEDDLLKLQNSNSVVEMLKVGDRFMKSLRKEMGFEDEDKVNILSMILTADARAKLM